MKQIYLKLIIIFIIFTNAFSENLEKVTLRLDWLHQFQFAGYYIAKEKGYFKELGLEVEIKEYEYGLNQVEEVINQKVDYGIGKSSLIIDKLKGKNIFTLAAIYQTSPMVLLTTNLNIKSPQDLYNRNVMLTSDARTAVAINSMITSKGVNLKDINFQNHSFKLDDLINGKTDAMGSYISNEPFLLKNKNIKYNILNPKDYGFDFYGGILFTSKYEVDKNPKRVQSFQKAVLKGWEYAFNNIDETISIIMNKYNTQNKSYSALLYEANSLKTLSGINENMLGDLNYKKLNDIKRIYSLLGYLDPKQELTNFIIFPKDVLLTEKEKTYLKEKTITYNSTIWAPFNNGLGNSSIELDYLNIIKNKINMDIRVRNNDLEMNSIDTVKNNIAHVKMLPVSKIDIKEEDFLVTKTINEFPLAIITRYDNSYISSTSMLNNKKIAILENNTLISNVENKYTNINLVKVKNLDEAFELLKNKKVYAILEILPIINHNIKKNKIENIKVAGVTEFSYELKYLLNKDDKILHSILNKTIERINHDIKDKINYKYIHLDYIINNKNDKFYYLFAFVSIVILLLIYINLKLNKEMKKRKDVEKKLSSIAHTDELTGLSNRRKMIKTLINSITLSKRYARPLSIIFFDIDNFKKINDEHGHAIGDIILKEISELMNRNLRSSDIIGRWGGEEFIVILPETSKENAKRTAENLREIVSNSSFSSDLIITCSFGVTTLKEDDTKKSFIQRADEAMYFVKRNGKNGVKVV